MALYIQTYFLGLNIYIQSQTLECKAIFRWSFSIGSNMNPIFPLLSLLLEIVIEICLANSAIGVRLLTKDWIFCNLTPNSVTKFELHFD